MPRASAHRLVGLVVLLLATLVTACGRLPTLRDNVSTINRNAAIYGTVIEPRPAGEVRVLLLAVDESGSLRSARSASVTDGQAFFFRVAPGRTFRLFAFMPDDGRGGTTRPWGFSNPITAAGPGAGTQVSIALDHDGPPPAEIIDVLARVSADPVPDAPVSIGEVASLDDPRFTLAAGARGLWAPADFMREVGSGLFFLAPFDPAKTPVLFISGAGGYPAEWRDLITALDGDRFQPWIYLYPSGLRLDRAAASIDGIVQAIQPRFPVREMVVVAHSMGGLVARAFVLRNAEHAVGVRIPRLLTISTPWNGHNSAALGVNYSPAAVPSWIDMVPNSDFQKEIFGRRLPAETRHAMIFTFRGRSLGEANDGVVTVASQLFQPAQFEAVWLRGFDETHDSILGAPDAIDLARRFIAGW